MPDGLNLVYRPLSWFKPYGKNPRKNDGAVDRMVASIREFGFPCPCLARSTGDVVDGHLRLKAAAKLDSWPGGGPDAIPVILCDGWTEAQVKAFRLMVNRSVAWADWDMDLLASEFAGLKALDFDLSLTGFDSRELDALLLTPNAAEDDVPPVPEVPTSRLGDLWVMGGHRLLCGDATKAEDVRRLMGDQTADLVFTDPPYGVGYDGGTTVRAKLQGDENTDLYAPCCDMAALNSKDGEGVSLD